ncbi:DUF6862 domain-containing protein, partial [Xylophilus ampelinus]|nr:hypothetical protein [Xylophilus ampelinus]
RSGALAKAWDGQQLEREVQAQTQITATFGQQATKKWGEFANGQQAAAQAAHDPQGETCWAETGACRVAGHALLGGLTGGASGALGAGVSAASVETVAGAADKIGLTGAARDLFIAGVDTSVGAAVGGAAGAAGAHNEVVNNYLSSQQWRDFAKDLDQCRKSAGDCTSVVNKYQKISNDQDTQLASACRDLDSPGCRSMVADVVGGRDAQIGLAIDGKLPANFIGGADLQGNGNLYERKVQAQDIVNACAADRTGCDQQRLRGSAQLLLTGVSIGALVVAAPGMAVEAGALVAEGAKLYCARRPDSCVALAETLGSTLGGVPQTGVGGSSIAGRGTRGGAPATGAVGVGTAGAGVKAEVPEVVAGAGTTGRGAAAAGSEAAIPTGRGAAPEPEPEVGKPNNLASGETRPVGRGTDAANDPVYGQGPRGTDGKLPLPTDSTATSPYSSNGRGYGKTTLTDTDGNVIPTQPTLPGAAGRGMEEGAGGSGNGAELPLFVNKPLGLGSTGRSIPTNLNEQLAIEQAISNPGAGRPLPVPMTDPRWPAKDGWVKTAQNINGVEIHYVRNLITGAVDDFKFK